MLMGSMKCMIIWQRMKTRDFVTTILATNNKYMLRKTIIEVILIQFPHRRILQVILICFDFYSYDLFKENLIFAVE